MTDEVQAKNNPLLNKLLKSNAMPGMTFRLPSKGLPYKNGELADEVQNGEVLVLPMSTLDEIYLKTPDMLFQGTAIDKAVGRCCPQILKPTELLSKDVDYILTCMRQVSYGNLLEVPYKCDCEKAQEVPLLIPISDFLKNTKTIELADMQKLSFEIDSYLVVTKYVTFDRMIKLNQENNQMDTPEEIFNVFIKNLSVNIESIDTVTDSELIVDFLKAQTRAFQMKLLSNIQDINEWGINFDYKHLCKWCNTVKIVPISLNPVSFFTEPSDQVLLSKSAA